MSACVFSQILGRLSNLNRTAILGFESVSYGDLLAQAERISGLLRSMGASSGKAVAIELPNSRSYIASLLAARHAGLVAIPINPKATFEEKQHVLDNSAADFHILLASSADITEVIEGVAILRRDPRDRNEWQVDDCLVIYTSGSTGRPKGVIQSCSGLSSNIRAVADYLALSAFDSAAVFTPPSYSYAVNQILTHLWVGGSILPWQHGVLSANELLSAITEAKVSGLQANPTMFEILLRNMDVSPIESIRYVMSGGQPLTSSLVRRMQAPFPNARFVNMYGCTENSPRIAFSWLPDIIPERENPWPVGRPVLGTHIRIFGENGELLPPGAAGEIAISGSSLMRSYLTAPELMQEKIKDGWFFTRDSGFVDANGELNLTGRIDNIISVGHEKVSPEEIENVIGSIPSVCDAAVTSIPDPLLLQVPVALIVHEGDFKKASGDIKQACARALSRSKFPRHILAVSVIPRTPYGKIDRKKLHSLAEKLLSKAPTD